MTVLFAHNKQADSPQMFVALRDFVLLETSDACIVFLIGNFLEECRARMSLIRITV